MNFTLLTTRRSIPLDSRSCAFLTSDSWDDWFKFETCFSLYVVDAQGVIHEPGIVKIGKVGLLPGSQISDGVRRAQLPTAFGQLDEGYFSLGQGETYYETLNALEPALRIEVLIGLRDCAYDLMLFERVANESVMTESLLRNVDGSAVRMRLNRLAHGNAVLTRFNFEYQFPLERQGIDPPRIDFMVVPRSVPLTNVHVLIGRNGVGKTRCMQGLAHSALGIPTDPGEGVGVLQPIGNDPDWRFAGLVVVSFSAFDTFELPAAIPPGTRAALIGLHSKVPDTDEVRAKTKLQLAEDFVLSLNNCQKGLKAVRWRAAVEVLRADPLFEEINVTGLLEDLDDEVAWAERAKEFFKRLSSGHSIVLLSITRLVDLVDEKTLVLIDEPEGHLHPPLLSAFIRSLADLLARRNGVALIATHSPVVLQEVPRSCVWILNRSGAITSAARPSQETFGENVGTLTREVFNLEVTSSGFHSLVRAAVLQQQLDYDSVLSMFSGQLGMEARAIARALVAQRDTGVSP